MAKKPDYAAMYTLRSDGRYMGYWHDADGGRHAIYDRDPESLYQKIQYKETPPVPTFADIAEAWHDKVWDNYRDGTRIYYSPAYKRAIDHLGDMSAASVSPVDVASLLQTYANKQYSVKTVKAIKGVVNLIYKNAITDVRYADYVKYNPAQNVSIPKNAVSAVKREAPDEEIIKSIRAKADTAYFGTFALFLISTGFRRGEALAVQWQDVDFKGGTISCNKSVSYLTGSTTIGEPKTKSGYRTVPLLPDLERQLKKTKDAKMTDYVFCGEDASKPMSQSTYRRHWEHYCKDMGFVDGGKHTLTPHFLRHGYATMLYDAGVDAYTAQQLLGHADIETTLAIYTHLSNSKKTDSIKKLADFADRGYKI